MSGVAEVSSNTVAPPLLCAATHLRMLRRTRTTAVMVPAQSRSSRVAVGVPEAPPPNGRRRFGEGTETSLGCSSTVRRARGQRTLRCNVADSQITPEAACRTPSGSAGRWRWLGHETGWRGAMVGLSWEVVSARRRASRRLVVAWIARQPRVRNRWSRGRSQNSRQPGAVMPSHAGGIAGRPTPHHDRRPPRQGPAALHETRWADVCRMYADTASPGGFRWTQRTQALEFPRSRTCSIRSNTSRTSRSCLGAMLPFVFAALTVDADGRAGNKMIEEVRRQFRDSRTPRGSSRRGARVRPCVDISTTAALREMLAPGGLAIVVPLVIDFVNVDELGGFLAGALVVGFCLATFMANAGGAWDNATNYIEQGAPQRHRLERPQRRRRRRHRRRPVQRHRRPGDEHPHQGHDDRRESSPPPSSELLPLEACSPLMSRRPVSQLSPLRHETWRARRGQQARKSSCGVLACSSTFHRGS